MYLQKNQKVLRIIRWTMVEIAHFTCCSMNYIIMAFLFKKGPLHSSTLFQGNGKNKVRNIDNFHFSMKIHSAFKIHQMLMQNVEKKIKAQNIHMRVRVDLRIHIRNKR